MHRMLSPVVTHPCEWESTEVSQVLPLGSSYRSPQVLRVVLTRPVECHLQEYGRHNQSILNCRSVHLPVVRSEAE